MVPRWRTRWRLVRLSAECWHHLLTLTRHGLLRHRPPDHRHRLAGVGYQSHRDRHQHARPRHDALPHASALVDAAGGTVPVALRHPRYHSCPVLDDVRPPL